MAGSTDYRYTIVLDGRQALAEAANFRRALQQELSQLNVQANIKFDKTNVQAGFQSLIDQATQAGTKGGQSFATSLSKAIEDKRPFQQLGVSPMEWGQMGGFERMAAGIQAMQRRMWGTRGLGYQMEAWGRGLMMPALAGAGAGAVAMREYIQYAEPLGRAARNLELNAQMTENLDQALRDMAGTVSAFSPEEQAEQLYLWAAATGATVDSQAQLNEILQQSIEVQKLAHLGMVSQGQAVEAVTDIQAQYGKNVDETQNIVATLVKVAAVSKAEVADLAQAFSYAGARASNANTTFEETAAVLQILSQYGMRGTRAGRGLGALLENLIAPSKQAKEVMDELFESAFGRTDVLITAEGQFVGIVRAISLLAQATQDLTEAERDEAIARITTQNAARVLIPLLDMQTEAQKHNIDALTAATNILLGNKDAHEDAFAAMIEDTFGYQVSTKSALDTANDQWATFLESVDGRTKMLKSSFAGSMLDIGKVITTYALPFIEDMADKVAELADMVTETPEILGGIAGVAGFAATVGALLIAFGKGIRLITDVKTVWAATTMMNAANLQYDAALMQLQSSGMAIPGGMRSGGGGAGRTIVAGAGRIVGGLILGNLVSQMTTDKDLYDLFSIAKERRAAREVAREEVAGMGVMDITQLRNEITLLEEHLAEVVRWEKSVAFPRTREAGGVPWAEIPPEMKGFAGMPQGMFIREEWKVTQDVLEIYRERLAELQELQIASFGVSDYWQRMETQTAATARETVAELEYLIRNWWRHTDALEAQEQAMGPIAPILSDQAAALVRLADQLGINIDLLDIFSDSLDGIRRVVLPGWDLGPLEASFRMMQDIAKEPYTPEELAAKYGTSARGGWGAAQRLLGIMSPEQILTLYEDEYIPGLQLVYAEVEGMDRDLAELRIQLYEEGFSTDVQGHVDAEREKTRATEKAIKDRQRAAEQAQEKFRSLVEKALTPTEVTAEDIWLTRAGLYETEGKKWDEYVRQLRAWRSPEWKHLIPPEMEMRGDEAEIEGWVKGRIDQFYAGLLPEFVDWDAFVARFKDELARQAGRERLIDHAMQVLAEAGIDATEPDVMRVLGLESPLQQAFLGGLSPEEAQIQLQETVSGVYGGISFADIDVSGPIMTLTGAIDSSIQEQLMPATWTQSMIEGWGTSITERQGDFVTLGSRIGNYLLDGAVASFSAEGLINAIVAEVLSILEGALAGWGAGDTTAPTPD